MASPRRRASRLIVALGALVAFGSTGVGPAAAAPTDLVGTFTITPGSCGSGATGSYFRMILPTGNANGPFIENSDSRCADKTYTLLSPGTDGGLVTGGYQPAPTPGFDGDGNSLATRLIAPVKFFGRNFSGSTNPTDLQVGQAVPAPVLRVEGTKITGDLTSFNATWNRQAFNQGAPKPGGATPGNTAPVTGTYDPSTGRYTITWASQIVGGPFDNFTGQWHLEGTFRATGTGGAVPASTATTAVAGPAGTLAPAAPAGGAADPTATTLAAGSPSTTLAQASIADEQALGATTVTDDSFRVPTALVVVIALLGIAGVIVLVVTDRRPDTGASA